MTQPPVTLQEFNDFLNVSDASAAGDEERWGRLVAAAELVEQRVGAMRPRQVTESFVRESGCTLDLTYAPLMTVSTVTAGGTELPTDHYYVDTTGYVSLRWPRMCTDYVVTYTVGRDPVPFALSEATLIVAEQLWQSQRGPTAARKFTSSGTSDTGVSVARGFAWPNRALELIEVYEDLGIA